MMMLKKVAYIAALLVTACSTTYLDTKLTEEQRSRVVLDAATRRPVAGAIAAFKWVRTDSDIAATRTWCVHAAIAISDSAGRYSVPTWHGISPVILWAYKPGMTSATERDSYSRGIDLIKTFEGNPRQRFQELERLVNSLNCPDSDIRAMQSLFVAIADEARSIARTDADARWAESFQVTADAAKYGAEEAKRRHATRLNQLGTRGGK